MTTRNALREGMEMSTDVVEKRPPSVCILVENLPAPYDRRVWQEARALTEAGYHVSIICPKALGLTSSYEEIDGIEIYRHPNLGGFHIYGSISWNILGLLQLNSFSALKVYRRTRFSVLQACNPPDVLFPIGVFFKLLGVRFVFDHHDVRPELFEAKFGKRGALYRLVCLAERLTFLCANVSIATNESYRDLAIKRGGISPERVFIVRSCLDLRKVRRVPPVLVLRMGRRIWWCTSESWNLKTESIYCFNRLSRLCTVINVKTHSSCSIGSGTETERLRVLASQMGLDDVPTFTGRIPDEALEVYLSTADVAKADWLALMNDMSTMNKILHYMSYGLPSSSMTLPRAAARLKTLLCTLVLTILEDFATLVAKRSDSESLRKELGECGRRRIEEKLNWEMEKDQLLLAYQTALKPDSAY